MENNTLTIVLLQVFLQFLSYIPNFIMTVATKT